MLIGLAATIDAAIANMRTILLFGASQYSAECGTNFSKAKLLESTPFGNQGFANTVHKLSMRGRSSTISPCPEIETRHTYYLTHLKNPNSSPANALPY